MLRPVPRPRTRELGLTFGSLEPVPLDAITDVEGVRVGSVTLIEGDGPLRRGQGPVRTGVTVVVPREGFEPLFAGCHRLNGNGELTGLEWVREAGCLGLIMSGDRTEGQLLAGVRAGTMPVGRGKLVRAGEQVRTV